MLEEELYFFSGVLETGVQGGGNCPPTFAEISPKLLQNKGFSLKFLFFAPQLVGQFQHLCISNSESILLKQSLCIGCPELSLEKHLESEGSSNSKREEKEHTRGSLKKK